MPEEPRSPAPAAPTKQSEWIWFDGHLVRWEAANVHVTTHALHYGSSVFEGLRAYSTHQGPAVLGLAEHTRRFLQSAKIFRMPLAYDAAEISTAILETVRANGHEATYIRPLAIRGAGAFGPYAPKNPIHVIVITLELEPVMGATAHEAGVDMIVSSWRRMAPGTHPATAKIGGNYVLTQLMAHDARAYGVADAIALDTAGNVSETGAANIFLVQGDQIYTPPIGDSILGGITRRFVCQLIRDNGLNLREETVPREMLYTSDEVFLTGTAVEVTPVRSIDSHVIGCGARGPVATLLQAEFGRIVTRAEPDRHGWLTSVRC